MEAFMLNFIMNFFADLLDRPVNAGPCKKYLFEGYYYDDHENEISFKTNGYYDLVRQEDKLFDSYLIDWEEAEAFS
jgi:hypothetical protein